MKSNLELSAQFTIASDIYQVVELSGNNTGQPNLKRFARDLHT